MSKEKDGLIGNLYGVNIAIEHNTDGSVTLCKELVEEILADGDVPAYIKNYLVIGNEFLEPKK